MADKIGMGFEGSGSGVNHVLSGNSSSTLGLFGRLLGCFVDSCSSFSLAISLLEVALSSSSSLFGISVGLGSLSDKAILSGILSNSVVGNSGDVLLDFSSNLLLGSLSS